MTKELRQKCGGWTLLNDIRDALLQGQDGRDGHSDRSAKCFGDLFAEEKGFEQDDGKEGLGGEEALEEKEKPSVGDEETETQVTIDNITLSSSDHNDQKGSQETAEDVLNLIESGKDNRSGEIVSTSSPKSEHKVGKRDSTASKEKEIAEVRQLLSPSPSHAHTCLGSLLLNFILL